MSARLFDDTPRPGCVRMNDRDQLARRLCRWHVKHKPTRPATADLLQPQRPAPARGRAISPTPTGDRWQTARHYRQTTRPAPMAQTIKPNAGQTINALTHDAPTTTQTNPQRQQTRARENPTTSQAHTNRDHNEPRRSQRHRQRDRPTTNSSTEAARRLACILAPM